MLTVCFVLNKMLFVLSGVGVFMVGVVLFTIGLIIGLEFPVYVTDKIERDQCLLDKDHPFYDKWVNRIFYSLGKSSTIIESYQRTTKYDSPTSL